MDINDIFHKNNEYDNKNNYYYEKKENGNDEKESRREKARQVVRDAKIQRRIQAAKDRKKK